jgi:hypothetical protein
MGHDPQNYASTMQEAYLDGVSSSGSSSPTPLHLPQQVSNLTRQKGLLVEQVRLRINPHAFQEHKKDVLAEILFSHKIRTGAPGDPV